FHHRENRELTSSHSARSHLARLTGARLAAAGPPTVFLEDIKAPSASTVAILAAAWIRYQMKPWDTMKSLQALYDGSWSEHGPMVFDPIDPIVPPEVRCGHPPITPLDRAMPPEQVKGRMSPADFAVYSLIWDYF